MTTSPMTLTDLRERVEGASGPDRELDLAIWRALYPGAEEIAARGKIPLPWLCCYTESIDAALALVEWKLPEVETVLSQRKPRRGETCSEWWHASIFPISPAVLRKHSTISCKGSTAPLAIILALLSALQAQGEK